MLDHDAEAVEACAEFGFTVHYGDATKARPLRVAGAETARCHHRRGRGRHGHQPGDRGSWCASTSAGQDRGPRATSRTTSSCASRPDPHRARDLRRRLAQPAACSNWTGMEPTPRASTRCASASTTSSCWKPRRPLQRDQAALVAAACRAPSSLSSCWPWSARLKPPGMPRRVPDGTTQTAPPGDVQQTPDRRRPACPARRRDPAGMWVKPFATF